jgi:hypothetical protein
MHVCMRSESDSASHSSPPLFKGVRVISACVRARVPSVCWYYFANLSTVSVCLPVHTVTQTLTHTSNTKNTDKYKPSNDRTPTLSLKESISVHSHKKHALTAAIKARQKRRLAGPTTGCSPKEASCIEEKQRVRQQAVRYTQKNKQTNIHTCVSVYVCVYAERERISVTFAVTTAAQGCASDLCMCVRARACAGTISLISLVCLFVCQCTP